MKRRTLLASFTALLLCVSIGPAQTRKTITPEDILSIRDLGHEIKLSPDGKQVAFVITEPADPKRARTSNIWVVPINGSQPPHPLIPNLKNAVSPRWSPDGRFLAFLSDRAEAGGNEGVQIHLAPSNGGEAERLTSVAGGVEEFAWSPDGKMIAFTAYEPPTAKEQERRAAGYDAIEVGRNFTYAKLWVTTLSDRKVTQITARSRAEQDFVINEFAWSPNGNELALVVARTARPEDSLLLSLVVVSRVTGEITRTLSQNASPISGDLRWSLDGRLIAFLEGPPTKEFASWLSIVPASGGQVRPLMKDYAGSVFAVEWLPDSKNLMVQTAEGTHQALLIVDTANGNRRKLTDVIQSQWGFGFTTNGNTTAYFAQTPESPSDIWVLTNGAAPRKITDFNPQTASWRIGKVRQVEWKNSKDGLVRRGVLVTPPDYQPGKAYPTIVNTHPGDTPWWIGFHGSQWWDWGQLLASNGYVVFLPNTRGVNGEGWRMHQTTVDWGGMAYQDLIDGVDYLVDEKIADPNRLGIGGWSNGGFMTEYTITHTTRFKAAVAQAAHADFFSLYGTSGGMRASMRVSTPDSPYVNRKWYDDHSPITLVRNCRTPTLLLHGERDGGVPVGQAYEFFTALKDFGVEAEMVLYPREGHAIQQYAHRIDLQKRVLAWFDKHLK